MNWKVLKNKIHKKIERKNQHFRMWLAWKAIGH